MLQLIFHGREDLDTVLHILVKFGYFLYWFFDNISVAAKLKLFQLDHLKYGRIASSCRLFALLLSILAYAYSRLSDNLLNGK